LELLVLARSITEVGPQSKYLHQSREVSESSYTNILKYAYKACTFGEPAFVELGSFEGRDILNVSGLATIGKLVSISDDLYQQKKLS